MNSTTNPNPMNSTSSSQSGRIRPRKSITLLSKLHSKSQSSSSNSSSRQSREYRAIIIGDPLLPNRIDLRPPTLNSCIRHFGEIVKVNDSSRSEDVLLRLPLPEGSPPRRRTSSRLGPNPNVRHSNSGGDTNRFSGTSCATSSTISSTSSGSSHPASPTTSTNVSSSSHSHPYKHHPLSSTTLMNRKESDLELQARWSKFFASASGQSRLGNAVGMASLANLANLGSLSKKKHVVVRLKQDVALGYALGSGYSEPVDIILLCFNLIGRSREKTEERIAHYWLPLIKHRYPEAAVILIGSDIRKRCGGSIALERSMGMSMPGVKGNNGNPKRSLYAEFDGQQDAAEFNVEPAVKPISTREGIQLGKRIGAEAYLEWDSEADFRDPDQGVAEIAGAIAWAAYNAHGHGGHASDNQNTEQGDSVGGAGRVKSMQDGGCIIA